MTTFWATIILLGVLITIHEYGHFIAARSVGIRVERFSIGIPPRFLTIRSIDDALEINIFFFKFLEGRFKWQSIFRTKIQKLGRKGSGTEYVIALLPLGGYVKMAGMIDESMDSNIQYEAHEFMSKPLLSKLWVLSAGVIMNTLLALIIFSALGYYQGVQNFKNEPVIGELQDNYPAQKSGLSPGDRIIGINNQPIDTWGDMTKIIHGLPNKEITLKILRDDIESELAIKTTFRLLPSENRIDTIGVIGIAPEIFYEEMTFFEASLFGWNQTLAGFGMIILSLKMVGSGVASVSDFGGPIMIAQLAGQTADAGLVPYLTLMALLSVNLAFLNILPIPGLDGGHIFIHLIEGIIRKPLTLKTRITIQQVGMAFILMLFVTIMFNDISRLFN